MLKEAIERFLIRQRTYGRSHRPSDPHFPELSVAESAKGDVDLQHTGSSQFMDLPYIKLFTSKYFSSA